jgi:hypothetical protein
MTTNTLVRMFISIIQRFCGASSLVDSIEGSRSDIIVIEMNGHIEAVDSLKSTFEGAIVTPMVAHPDRLRSLQNVFDDSFDDIPALEAVRVRHLSKDVSLSNMLLLRACQLLRRWISASEVQLQIKIQHRRVQAELSQGRR